MTTPPAIPPAISDVPPPATPDMPSPSSTPAPAPWRPTRRQVLRTLFWGTTAAILAVPTWMRYVEPHWLDISRRQLRLTGLAPDAKDPARPLRLLHMSDFHASDYIPLDMIDAAIDHAADLQPDLICLTGDFVTDAYTAPNAAAYSAILARLPALAPTFACFGNHDGNWGGGNRYFPTVEHVHGILKDGGIHVLYNASTVLEIGGRAVQLVGVGDLWAGELDAAAAFGRDPAAIDPIAVDPGAPARPTILLAHNPDCKDRKGQVADFPWQLMLCGHTHGGQLRIPFDGRTPFAPIQDRRYVAGLNAWNERWIHTSRGVGNLHGMRLNCRPEITLLDLLPG